MGRFLDEAPSKTYKGRFLDDEPVKTVTPEVIPARKRTFKDKILDAGGGPMFLAGGGQNPEDTIPMLGQVVGSSIPGVNSFGGSVAGATAGQAMRQGVKAIRGTRDSQPRQLFGTLGNAIGLPKAPGIVNDLAGEAAGTAAFEGAARGLGRLAEPVANRIMNSVIRPSVQALKKNPRLGLDALESGIYGSREGMIGKADDIIKQSEKQIGKIISGSKKRINAQDIINSLDSTKQNATLGLKPEDVSSVSNIKEQFLKRLPMKQSVVYSQDSLGVPVKKIVEEPDMLGLDLTGGQEIKKAIYSETPESAFNRNISENPGATEARRKIASLIKKQIGQAEPETLPILKKESNAIQAKKSLMQALANSQRSVILPKLAGMGAGSLAAVGNPIAAAGVLAGDRAIDLLRSPYFVTGLAKNILRAKTFGNVLSPALREVSRRLG